MVGLLVAPVAVIAAQLAVAPKAEAAVYPIVVLHHNIGGGQSYGGGDGAVDPINNYINQYPYLSVVTMNEVCASQRDEFVANHPGWYFFWWKTRDNDKCDNNATPATTEIGIGEMIASPYPLIGNYKHCLMRDAGGNEVSDTGCHSLTEAQGLLCTRPQIPGLPAGSNAYEACVTHLGTFGDGPDDATRAWQTAKIERLLAPYHSQRMITVSGDFNSEPTLPSLNNMYRQRTTVGGPYTGPGDFVDADATNESKFGTRPPGTHCSVQTSSPSRPPMCRTGQNTATTNEGVSRKIDYVFFPFDRMKFGSYGAGTVALFSEGGGLSNHRVLITGGYVQYPGMS